MSKHVNALDAAVLIVAPLSLVACAVLSIKASAFLTLAIGIASMVIFFAGWERSKPAVEQIVPVVIMSSLAACGRIAMVALPDVQPVSAICVISGCVLGARSGFMVGALAAFASDCFLGLGPWVPWQMYGWGLVGFASGAIFCKRATPDHPLKAAVCVFGFVASFVYGALMDTWMLVGFTRTIAVGSAIAVYGAGAAFNMAHAMSTVAFLLVLYVPWAKKILRYRARMSSQIVANDNNIQ